MAPLARLAVLTTVAMTMCCAAASARADAPTDVQDEINRSIAAFPGECPCPYSKDPSGQTCGTRSAYFEGLGNKYHYTPFCYPGDVQLPPLEVAPKTKLDNHQKSWGL